MIEVFAILGSCLWLILLILPWQPWRYREQLDSDPEALAEDLSDVTVLIPARNEEETIARTLEAIRKQSENISVILVNDQSTDKTKEKALQAGLKNLRIIDGEKIRGGWAGKLWALEQGRKQVQTDFILLMDADIEPQPGIFATLRHRVRTWNLDFISLMAHLKMENFWEKLLIPAYIYYFKLLYPFALGNNFRLKQCAVAAGGCILLRREALENIGGFAAIQGALIDDCNLAKKIKAAGYRTWTGTTHSVSSHRGYESLGEAWNLVTRFAYTYLRYNPLLLLICLVLLISAYWVPPVAVIAGVFSTKHSVLILAAWLLQFFLYFPTAQFYRLSPLWIVLHPLSGTLYMAMTLTSAWRYHRGERSNWRGRIYDHQLAVKSDSAE